MRQTTLIEGFTLSDAIRQTINHFKGAAMPIHTERWQGVDISKKPEAKMMEVLFINMTAPVSWKTDTLALAIRPNMPWAEEHFLERVSGEPLNPGETWRSWPWSNKADEAREEVWGPSLPPQDWAYLAGMIDGEGTIYFRDQERWQGVIRVYQKNREVCDFLLDKFKVGKVVDSRDRVTSLPGDDEELTSNPMAYWQVNAMREIRWILHGVMPYLVVKKEKAQEAWNLVSQLGSVKEGSPLKKIWGRDWEPRFNHTYMSRMWPKGDNGTRYQGLKYRYGDLEDLIAQFLNEPFTRQGYLPIWFPEDTGVANPGRKPCSLGYHFIVRDGQMHCSYYIRSCDIVRHFRDDIYLTCRLMQWILSQLRKKDDWWDRVLPGVLRMDIGSLHCFINDFNSL